MFKKLMQKLGVSVLVAILPVVLMGGVVYADETDDLLNSLPPVQASEDAIDMDAPAADQKAANDKVIEGFNQKTSAEVSGEVDSLQQSKADLEKAIEAADPRSTDINKNEAVLQQKLQQVNQELEQKKAELTRIQQGEELDAQKEALEAQKSKDADNALRDAQTAGERATVLPSTSLSIAQCKTEMNKLQMDSVAAKKKFEERDDVYIRKILGCGIKTGDISLWMVPYYIRFILEFILQLGGLVAVGGIIYGGYLYLFAGLSDDKDRGKKAILYGVGGIVLAMTAWALVNIVISVVTA